MGSRGGGGEAAVVRALGGRAGGEAMDHVGDGRIGDRDPGTDGSGTDPVPGQTCNPVGANMVRGKRVG